MTFLDFQNIITNVGGGVITNAIYDAAKYLILNSKTKEELIQKLDNTLHLFGVNASAESIVSIIASKGFILIEGSHIKSNTSITMGSSSTGELTFGNNSTSETDKTKIEAGIGTFIKMYGNAKIEQGKDGSIKFYT
jgi:hypothetical protein